MPTGWMSGTWPDWRGWRCRTRRRRQLQAQLDDILAFVGELKSLDVSGVAPTDDASGVQNSWREDEPIAGLPREAALANAPLARHGQFVVPKVVE